MPRHVSDDTTIVVELSLYEESVVGENTYADIRQGKIFYKGGDLEEARRVFNDLTATINTRTSS